MKGPQSDTRCTEKSQEVYKVKFTGRCEGDAGFFQRLLSGLRRAWAATQWRQIQILYQFSFPVTVGQLAL